MKIFCYTILIISLSSCALFGRHEPTIAEKQEAFKAVALDQKIIADFAKYNALAGILLLNLDTIIKYKNSNNYVTVIDNHEQSQLLREENCFMFLKDNDYYDIKKIPAYLSQSADSLWTLVDKPEIEICKDKMPASLVIKKTVKKRENGILECHYLYWNLKAFDNYDSFDIVKDTLLAKDCIYRIGITTDHSGW
jgi:hypothetical protein